MGKQFTCDSCGRTLIMEFKNLGNISDHVFASILRKKDKNWTCKSGFESGRHSYTHFYDSLGNQIAYCIYDNQTCAKQVYVR